MRSKKELFFVLVFLSAHWPVYSQVTYKDPFESPFLKALDSEEEEVEEVVEKDLGPPPVTIEGIFWTAKNPLAIIDGEVYQAGAKIKDVDAKVFKIDKGAVFIYFGNKLHQVKIKKKPRVAEETVSPQN